MLGWISSGKQGGVLVWRLSGLWWNEQSLEYEIVKVSRGRHGEAREERWSTGRAWSGRGWRVESIDVGIQLARVRSNSGMVCMGRSSCCGCWRASLL